jgi:LysR family glycine cleavage system transcriptional activator
VSKQIAQLEAPGPPAVRARHPLSTLTPAAERLLPFVREGWPAWGGAQRLAGPAPRTGDQHLRAPCASRWLLRRLQAFEGEAVEVRGSHSHGIDFSREPSISPSSTSPAWGAIPTASPVSERLTPVCAPAFAAKHRLFERDLNELPLLPSSMPAPIGGLAQLVCRLPRHPGSPRGQLFDTLDLAMNAALQGFGLSRGSHHSGRGAGERRPGRSLRPVLETDHEYALLARPDSRRHGVQRVCHWLLEGRVIPEDAK